MLHPFRDPAPAPVLRKVPASLALRLLLGHRRAAFAWSVLVVGALSSWRALIPEARRAQGELGPHVVVPAVLEGVTWPRGDGAAQELRLRYRFQDAEGVVRHGTASIADPRLADGNLFVEYPWGRPAASHLVGARRGRGGRYAFLLLTVPLLGAALVILETRRALARWALLRRGRVTLARRVDGEPTMSRCGGRRVGVRFAFLDDHGETHALTTWTSRPETLGPLVPVIHDPDTPRRVSLLASLPGAEVLGGGTSFASPGFERA